MHSKSDNIENMISDNLDEVMQELHQVLLSTYQIGLETLIVVLISYLIVSTYYIINAIKKFKMRWITYRFVK